MILSSNCRLVCVSMFAGVSGVLAARLHSAISHSTSLLGVHWGNKHTQYIHTNENLRFYHRRCHKLGLASKSATHR